MNILHLSDIHFGRNYKEYGISDPFEHHDQIIDGIIEKIQHMDDRLKPEHIIFTGDLVWHGKRREYKEALDWFQRLLKACNLSGKDISFCVGNHDIDLSCQYDNCEYVSDMVDEIDELYRYDQIHQFDACLRAFDDFCREIGTIPYSYPSKGARRYSYSMGYKDIAFEDDKKIRIIAMNTALLMTQSKISEDKMWLGREQINELIRYGIIPGDKDIYYTIGLFHHSDRFLHPNETSSYDGRSATLPLLMECTDLLACGHTESSGRPRIGKQPGGATILFGGAAYYNDEHMNSFSMIYISEKKKRMGYIPCIYDGQWRDYEFCSSEEKYKKSQLENMGQRIDHAFLILKTPKEKYTIPFTYLEYKKKEQQISSEIDCANPIRIFYDGSKKEVLKIFCPTEQQVYARSWKEHYRLLEFLRRAGGIVSCRKFHECTSGDSPTCVVVSGKQLTISLFDSQGSKIKEFSSMEYQPINEGYENEELSTADSVQVQPEAPRHTSGYENEELSTADSVQVQPEAPRHTSGYENEESFTNDSMIAQPVIPRHMLWYQKKGLMEELLLIEEFYDVQFTLPPQISKDEYDKIDLLKKLANDGFTDRVKVIEEFRLQKNYEQLRQIYEIAQKKNQFGLFGEEQLSIRLFNVNVMVGKVHFHIGPFCVDLEDLRYKLETYREDDVRTCLFQKDDAVKALIIKDSQIQDEYLKEPMFALIDHQGALKVSLDL